VARNRKRRNDRRPRRPADEASARPGVATARAQRPEPVSDREAQDIQAPAAGEPALEPTAGAPEGGSEAPGTLEGPETPGALDHAAPDVELAEAQLAAGRAEAQAAGPVADDPASEAEFEAEEAESEAEERESAGTQLTSRGEAAPKVWIGNRLVHFLQGSWRELQRVQWPDRRQVMQATGVVIGFVIVAGVFLGVADWAAQKIVNFILK
jgi:preprotein translocase subunit SecE